MMRNGSAQANCPELIAKLKALLRCDDARRLHVLSLLRYKRGE